MTLTKRDLVIRISTETDIPQQQVLDVVQRTLDYISESVAKGDNVELRNFGVFEVKRRKPRKARNPRTGDAVDVEAKNVVTFQPGKIMEEKVREAKKVVVPKRKTRKPATPPIPIPMSIPIGGDELIPMEMATASQSEMPHKPR